MRKRICLAAIRTDVLRELLQDAKFCKKLDKCKNANEINKLLVKTLKKRVG